MKVLKNRGTSRAVWMAAAFGIPCLVLCTAYLACGLAPFGEDSLISMDGYSQYYPMLLGMRRAIKSGNVLYSYEGALGFNLWAQNAYYTNSPLWLMLYLLPGKWFPSGIDLIVMLRFGLAGAACFWWLAWRYAERGGEVRRGLLFWYLALSCAYALSGWMIAFLNQFMWADIVVLLPLIMLGAKRLIRERKCALYVVSLFLAMWSCFYIAYMVCLFLCLYVLVDLAAQKRPGKEILRTCVRFAASSVLAAALAAPVLLPVFQAIRLTKAAELGFEGGLEQYHSWGAMLARLLPFGKIALEYEAPNLYCGVMTVLGAGIYLLNKKVPLRRRLAEFLLAVFLIVSLNVNLLDYIWHGFHYPNQLPGRESFLLAFWLITMAGKAGESAAGCVQKEQGNSCRMGNAIDRIQLAQREKPCRLVGKRNVRYAAGLGMLCSAALLVEVSGSAIYQIMTQTWQSSNSLMWKYDGIMESFVDIEAGETELSWHRQEFASRGRLNPAQEYGYSGITYYSSTMSGAAYQFFLDLGMPVYAKNVSTWYEGNDLLNALFCVRYSLNEDGTIEEHSVLPPAFRLGGGGETGGGAKTLPEELTQKEKQRWLWAQITGYEWEEGKEAKEAISASYENRLRLIRFDAGNIEGTTNWTKSGMLFFSIPYDEGWKAKVDGKAVPVQELFGYFCGIEVGEGEHVITMTYTPPGLNVGIMLAAAGMGVVLIVCLKERRIRKKKIFAG